MNPAAVWRSNAPEVLAAWSAWLTDRAAWGERVTSHSMSVAGEPAVTRRWVDLETYVGPGIGEQAEAPPGWRIEPPLDVVYTDGPRYLLPNRRSKAGKENARVVQALGSNKRLQLPGTPLSYVGLSYIYHPNVQADADPASTLTLSWSTADVEHEVDAALWSRVPLSQWHAEQEAKEAAR